MRYGKFFGLALLVSISTGMVQADPPSGDTASLSDAEAAKRDSLAQKSSGFGWRTAMSAAVAENGSFDNVAPDVTLGWTILLDDSMNLRLRARKLRDAPNLLIGVATIPIRLFAYLCADSAGYSKRRLDWKFQAGPTLSTHRQSENPTEYFQSLMFPANGGFSMTSYWAETIPRDWGSSYDVRDWLGTIKVVGGLGWGMKFFPPYKGEYVFRADDDSCESPNGWVRLGDTTNTDVCPLKGIIQHYFRAGLGIQLGEYLAISANYSLAYHDVLESSHQSYVKLIGNRPNRNGFQYLTANLQTLLKAEDKPENGGLYFDITWRQQLEHQRWKGTPFEDRQVIAVGLRKDFRELPLAFTN